MGIFTRLKFLRACLAIIKNPAKTDEVLASIRGLKSDERFLPVKKRIFADPVGAAIVQNRKFFKYPSLETLKTFNEGTVGKNLYIYLSENKLDPYYFRQDGNDEISFIRDRVRTVHDLWHVATDYTTSIEDELGLQGFTFGQLDAPGSILIISLLLLHFMFYKPSQMASAFRILVEGYLRGKNSSFLFSVDWDHYYSLPLVELRKNLKIEPRA